MVAGQLGALGLVVGSGPHCAGQQRQSRLGRGCQREDGVSLGVLEHQPSRGRSGKVGFTLVHVYVCVHVCVSACAYVNAHCHTVKGEQVREQFLRSAQSEP